MSHGEKTCILIVEDDISLCKAMTIFLDAHGFDVLCAHDGKEALDMLARHQPRLIIADIKMPMMDGIHFLIEARARGIMIPVIITTGYPDLDSALQALHNGAYDYIIKPYQPEMLLQKIRRALAALHLESENVALSRLVSLHEIVSTLAGIHDLEELFGFTLDSCLRILEAQSGSIQLYEKEHDTLVLVRHRGMQPPVERSPMADGAEWAISKWVARNGRTLLIGESGPLPDVDVPLERENIGSALAVPLKIADKVIGVINLNRELGKEPFTTVDVHIIEVFASQASIAISNAKLYASLNRKIEELSLIGRYSEELMGRVERIDVVRCLFETVHRHFPIDFIGFLLPKKRFHEFLYWSRAKLPNEDVNRMCGEAVAAYNKNAPTVIQQKRVTIRPVALNGGNAGGAVSVPFAFIHTIPVRWGDVNMGITYFAAAREPADTDETVSLLQNLVNQTRIALTNTKLYDDVKENYIRTIKALAIAVDAKDTYTHGHSENVMNLAEAIATEMRLDEKGVGIIRDAGLLHDIGKIGIPGYILNKPGPLTYEEFNGVMKTHAMLGANIVKDVPFLRQLYFLILSHHEHFDGSGYPDGLSGDQIPIGARILHVADAFEAMTSNRPYRASLGKKEALRRLVDDKGKQFDPDVVEAFIRIAQKKGWI